MLRGCMPTGDGARRLLLSWIIALTALFCLIWTVGIILLTIAPAATINWVMDTQRFDSGDFWLLASLPTYLQVMSVVGLAVLALGYLSVVVRVIYNSSSKWNRVVPWGSRFHSVSTRVVSFKATASRFSSRALTGDSSVLAKVVDKSSQARKTINFVLKLVDFAFQGVLLHQILESGLPVRLVYAFVCIIAANALTCALIVGLTRKRAGIYTFVADTCVDFAIVQLYPMLVMGFSIASFTFDRRLLAINQQVFTPGAYESNASVLADPVQRAVVMETISWLRVYSLLNLFARMGTNLVMCARLHDGLSTLQSPDTSIPSPYPGNRRISLIFVLIAAVTIVWTEESVRTSSIACDFHPECSIHAWRWITIDPDPNQKMRQCPCLTLVDVDPAPRSWDEWMEPKNATETLAQLASTGDLRVIHIANRAVYTLPDQVWRCSRLRQLMLYYTHIATLPPWAKDLTALQYLHIEGNEFGSLVSLPDDLFERMHLLSFVHIANHAELRQLPSFDGLSGLTYLKLAKLLFIEALPPFDALVNLRTLVLVGCSTVQVIPDMAPLQSLQSFTTFGRNAYCCNGFWTPCNPSHWMCQPNDIWGLPAVPCLSPERTDNLITDATRNLLERFATRGCSSIPTPAAAFADVSSAAVVLCGGVMYKECQIGDQTGICSSRRMMAIACTLDNQIAAMRRLQIQEGAGDRCDPQVEAWLGCRPA